jgi:hypothetical protein
MQRPGRDGPRAASTDELADYIAMIACASLAATGAVLAWLMIGADALEAEPKRRGRPPGGGTRRLCLQRGRTPLAIRE